MTLQALKDYGAAFQVKTLGALLTKKDFLQTVYDVLTDEHFPNPAHKWIIGEICKYWDKYHTIISMEVLSIELKRLDNEILQTSIKEQLKEAYKHSDAELAYVEEEFTAFCIKIKMVGTNSSEPPLLKDLRAIALAV